MSKNSDLQPLVTPFPIKINITPQPLGAAFRKLAAAFRSYIERKGKRDHEKRARTRTYSFWSPHFLPKLISLLNHRVQPFANWQLHFIAILEQNKKELRKTSYLQPFVAMASNSVSPKKQMGTAYTNFLRKLTKYPYTTLSFIYR